MREETKVFLNTWGAYNDGSIGYGWMTPAEARDFIDNEDERDGGEWFIADIDNYLGVKFSNLEYCNVMEILDTLEELECLQDYELDIVIALMEYKNTNDVQEVLDVMDDYSTWEDLDSYHDYCDELIEEETGKDSILARYFDWDAYHRDCNFDIYEASNGVCILCY